jgi:chemotaxis protein MotB
MSSMTNLVARRFTTHMLAGGPRRAGLSRRLAPTLIVSVILHGAVVGAMLPGAPGPPGNPDFVVVELVGLGQPAAAPSEVATVGPDAAEHASDPLTLGAAAVSPPALAIDDRVAALVAERDELAERLESETAARARLGDEAAALAADNLTLESELAEERRRAARLEQSLAERRAEEAVAIRELAQTYDALLAALRDEITEKDVALRRAREGLTVNIVDRVLLFPSGQARLTPQGRDVIDKLARVLATTPARRIIIEGHTDDVPIGPELRARFPSNWELSTARATEVVRRLVERGMSPLALEAVGRADTRPVASNDTEDGRRHNRRIAIIVPGSAASPAEPLEPGA